MNINEPVWVKLTPFGWRLLREHWNKFQKLTTSQIKELHGFDGAHYKFQLWNLMQIYGPHLFMGCAEMPLADNAIYLSNPAEAGEKL